MHQPDDDYISRGDASLSQLPRRFILQRITHGLTSLDSTSARLIYFHNEVSHVKEFLSGMANDGHKPPEGNCRLIGSIAVRVDLEFVWLVTRPLFQYTSAKEGLLNMSAETCLKTEFLSPIGSYGRGVAKPTKAGTVA